MEIKFFLLFLFNISDIINIPLIGIFKHNIIISEQFISELENYSKSQQLTGDISKLVIPDQMKEDVQLYKFSSDSAYFHASAITSAYGGLVNIYGSDKLSFSLYLSFYGKSQAFPETKVKVLVQSYNMELVQVFKNLNESRAIEFIDEAFIILSINLDSDYNNQYRELPNEIKVALIEFLPVIANSLQDCLKNSLNKYLQKDKFFNLLLNPGNQNQVRLNANMMSKPELWQQGLIYFIDGQILDESSIVIHPSGFDEKVFTQASQHHLFVDYGLIEALIRLSDIKLNKSKSYSFFNSITKQDLNNCIKGIDKTNPESIDIICSSNDLNIGSQTKNYQIQQNLECFIYGREGTLYFLYSKIGKLLVSYSLNPYLSSDLNFKIDSLKLNSLDDISSTLEADNECISRLFTDAFSQYASNLASENRNIFFRSDIKLSGFPNPNILLDSQGISIYSNSHDT